MTAWIGRRAVLGIFPILAVAAYPIPEYVIAGTRALVYGRDVFDDGSVARLGALAATWREQGFTLWDPFLTGGNAWFSQFALPPIAPDTLLTLLLTPFQAFFATQLALPLVASVSMYLFARRSLRLPVAAGVVGATIYALSLWHYPIGLAGPALPLMLTAVDRVTRRTTVAVTVHAAILVVVLHQGLLQVVLLAGLVQLGWLVSGIGTRHRRNGILVFVGGWLIALLVAAPTLVSLAVALPESHRVVWDLARQLTLAEAGAEVLHRYASVLLAAPLPGGWGLHSAYLGTWFGGAIAIPLAALGAYRSALTGRRFRFLPVLAVVIPVIELATLLAGPLLENAGPLRSFQFDRVGHFVPFLVASSAAVGVTALRGVASRGTRAWGSRAALALGVGVLAVQAPAVLDRIGQIRALGETLAPDWVRAAWLLTSVVGVVLVLAMAAMTRPRAVATAALVLGLIVCLGVERASYLRVERGLVPNGTTSWQERLGGSAIIGRLVEETAADHSRVVATGLYPNTMLFHRIRSVTGYENLYPLRMHELLDVLLAPYLDPNHAASDYFRKWGNRAVVIEPVWARQVVDLLGARWIVSDRPIDEQGITPVLRDGGETLYRNDAALPRAFVVTAARAFERPGDLRTAMAEATTGELATTAFVESEAIDDSAERGSGETGSAEFVVDRSDRVELAVTSPADGLLIVTDAFMPGWEATVDGRTAAVLPAYAALRAVAVPEGRSTVVLTYAPIPTRVALAASVVGLLALVGLLAIGMRRR